MELCRCGSMRERRVAGQWAEFPGRPFYKCNQCSQFDWGDTARRKLFEDDEIGPVCECGKASVQRAVKKASENQGRKFWACATFPGGCGFVGWKEPDLRKASPAASTPSSSQGSKAAQAPGSETRKRPALPGYATYNTDWNKSRLLQKLLMAGVDHQQMQQSYDHFEMVGVWKITNPLRMESYTSAKERERHKMLNSGSAASDNLNLPEEYESLMKELAQGSLDEKAGEMLLLHGTSPEDLHSILFEGLDPQVARDGKFGRGVYFAENAAKIDQYALEDKRFQKKGPLADLHHQLYLGTGCRHATKVRYCLVSRVVLGFHARTKNGTTYMETSKPMFQDDRHSQLAPVGDDENERVPSSLVAELGGRNRSFREFMLFNSDQIFVEYVIAYQRTKKYCRCGLEVVERTVVKRGPNRGRKIHFCANPDETKKCDFVCMFPQCDCGKSALVKTSHSADNPDRNYYTCNHKQQSAYYSKCCQFFQWCEETMTAPRGSQGISTNPYKRAKTVTP